MEIIFENEFGYWTYENNIETGNDILVYDKMKRINLLGEVLGTNLKSRFSYVETHMCQFSKNEFSKHEVEVAVLDEIRSFDNTFDFFNRKRNRDKIFFGRTRRPFGGSDFYIFNMDHYLSFIEFCDYYVTDFSTSSFCDIKIPAYKLKSAWFEFIKDKWIRSVHHPIYLSQTEILSFLKKGEI